jgi:hypothetical protein
MAHVLPPLVYNLNLCQENTVHRPVVGETRLPTNVRQLVEAVAIPENAVTPVYSLGRHKRNEILSSVQKYTVKYRTPINRYHTMPVFFSFLLGARPLQCTDLS